MKLRTLAFWTTLYGWLGLISYWAVMGSGPWRWVADLYGFPTHPAPGSVAFDLIALTLGVPVLVMAWVRGEPIERERAKETLANATGIGDNRSAP